ncbi:hypothetical protein TIFTF001_033609 [Ficus carica]|uniref:Uncharacterized protein n=1 Tax=Ficus carica TaxID=3494 RepID=A0AA88J9D7_FICCA|nr:hypothetical protein TIFTF001_033609 [Ficus carica]
MRLQWPRFLTKPEPEVPRIPARPGPLHGPGSLHGQDWFHRNIARRSVPTGFNSTLDTAFTNEVSSLTATPDTIWKARGVRRGLQHRARAVGGVVWGCFEAEHGELVAVRHPQIQACLSLGLVDTTRVGLSSDGEGVGSVRGLALPVVVGVCPSRAVSFSSLLLAFFQQWSDRANGCSDVDGCGFAGVFCVDLDFVDRVLVVVWLGVVWWADLACVSPIVGVFLRVWDRGSLRLSPSGRIIYVLSRWFVDFRSI